MPAADDGCVVSAAAMATGVQGPKERRSRNVFLPVFLAGSQLIRPHALWPTGPRTAQQRGRHCRRAGCGWDPIRRRGEACSPATGCGAGVGPRRLEAVAQSARRNRGGCGCEANDRRLTYSASSEGSSLCSQMCCPCRPGRAPKRPAGHHAQVGAGAPDPVPKIFGRGLLPESEFTAATVNQYVVSTIAFTGLWSSAVGRVAPRNPGGYEGHGAGEAGGGDLF